MAATSTTAYPQHHRLLRHPGTLALWLHRFFCRAAITRAELPQYWNLLPFFPAASLRQSLCARTRDPGLHEDDTPKLLPGSSWVIFVGLRNIQTRGTSIPPLVLLSVGYS